MLHYFDYGTLHHAVVYGIHNYLVLNFVDHELLFVGFSFYVTAEQKIQHP